jgi:PKD repeat protein
LESRLAPANSIAATPLNDLGSGLYDGYAGGLYPNGLDSPPPVVEAAATQIASQQILPLDSNGQVDRQNGKIVMISVGMSNVYQEWASDPVNSFMPRAYHDPALNPQLVLVNGAQPGKAVDSWVSPVDKTWDVVDESLAAKGFTPDQVEVAWIKQAEIHPQTEGSFPTGTQELQQDLESLTRALYVRFPHIRIAYFSSRIYCYTTAGYAENPEPYAYQSGFAVKWAIQDQIQGLSNLNWDSNKGPVVAPLMLWGPYLWADGVIPRSDGLQWLIGNFDPDMTHPSPSGIHKVSDQLLAFFKTDPSATPWFLRVDVGAPTLTASALPSFGFTPFLVHFSASANVGGVATIVQYAWNFDDGDPSLLQNPTKMYDVPGTYTAWVTVTDSLGDTTTQLVTVSVQAPLGAAADLLSALPAANRGVPDQGSMAESAFGLTRTQNLSEQAADLAFALPHSSQATSGDGFSRAVFAPRLADTSRRSWRF